MKFQSKMQLLPICVLFVTSLCFKEGYSLSCYECDDCNVLTDSQLKTCQLQPPTPPTPQESTTPKSTESTEVPSKTTETSTKSDPDASSPISPASPTTQEPTTLKTTENTEEPSKTTEATIETEPSTITEITTESTISGETSEKEPTTKETTIVVTDPPTVAPSTSEASTENTNPLEQPPKSGENISVPEMRPLEIPKLGLSQPINIAPAQLAVAPERKPLNSNAFAPVYNRFRRATNVLRAEPTSHCYSISILDGDVRKTKKGCIEVPEDKAACDILTTEFGTSVDKCKVCTEDKCNNSSPLKLSMIVFLIGLVLRLILN